MRTVMLEEVLASPDLPTLPRIALDLLELTRDPDVDIADVARLIQFDQALTAKILRTVNSSYYGLARPCTSIQLATAYLGLNTVKSIVLGLSLVDLTRRGGKGLDLVDYWRRCIYSAAAARRLATQTRLCEPEEAFLAALMQDVGMLTLHTATGRLYDDVLGSTRGDHRLLPQCELKRFGFTHADAGAGLGSRWRLPKRIIEPIRLHHRGDAPDADESAAIVRTVAMSYRLATAIAGNGGAAELRAVYAMGDRNFGLSMEDVRALLARSSEDARILSGLLEVKIGDQVDLERVLSEARETIARAPAPPDEPVRREVEAALTVDAWHARLRRALHAAAVADEDLGLVVIAVDESPTLEADAIADVVTSEIRRRITRFAGDDVTVHRTGHHAMAVTVPKANRVRATLIAEGIRSRVALARFTVPAEGDRAAPQERFTVSIGVAAFESGTRKVFHRPEVLTAAAGRALSKAREHGNTVEAFIPGARAA